MRGRRLGGVALLALIGPRVAIVGVWLFSNVFSRAYDDWFVPFIGFFLLPWTTLAYAIMWDIGTHEGLPCPRLVIGMWSFVGHWGLVIPRAPAR